MAVSIALTLLTSWMLLPPATTPETERVRAQTMQLTKEWKWLAPDKNARFSNGSMVIADPGTVEYKPLEIYSQVVPNNEVQVKLPEFLEPVGSYFRIGVRSQAFDALFRTFKIVLPIPVNENPELLHMTFLTSRQQWNAGVPGSMANRFGRPYANAETLYGIGTVFVLTRNKNLSRRPVIKIFPRQLPNENREIGILRPDSVHHFRSGAKVYAPPGTFAGRPLVVYSQIIQAQDAPVLKFEDMETVDDYYHIGAYDDDIGSDRNMFEFSIPIPKGEKVWIAVLSIDDVYDKESSSSWIISPLETNRLLDGRFYVSYIGMERKGAVFVLIRRKTTLSEQRLLQRPGSKKMPFHADSLLRSPRDLIAP